MTRGWPGAGLALVMFAAELASAGEKAVTVATLDAAA
jgi:hypothetical protein